MRRVRWPPRAHPFGRIGRPCGQGWTKRREMSRVALRSHGSISSSGSIGGAFGGASVTARCLQVPGCPERPWARRQWGKKRVALEAFAAPRSPGPGKRGGHFPDPALKEKRKERPKTGPVFRTPKKPVRATRGPAATHRLWRPYSGTISSNIGAPRTGPSSESTWMRRV